MGKNSLFIVAMLFQSFVCFGQNYQIKEIDLNLFIEEIFPQQDEDLNYEELYETLFLLYQNPLNLNKVTKNELQSLFILSELQIRNFFNYIEASGPLLTVYELQAIPGFDLPTIYKLIPFITVKDPGLHHDPQPLLKRILSEKNNMLILRYERTLEEKRGYSPADTNRYGQLSNRYLGSPDKVYSRFRVSHSNDFSLGFTVEKDAGERIVYDRNIKTYGMDFYSYHFFIQNKGRLKGLVVGDYQIQIGQSLLLGAGFLVGKGAETVNTIRRSSLGIRPYTSVVESGFFRGAAATMQFGKLYYTGFYSNTLQDGNVVFPDSVNDSNPPLASSIYTTGYHRTPTEISNKNQINEQVTGLNVQYKSTNARFETGVTFLATLYDVYLKKVPRKYNQYEFEGDKNLNYGINFSYNWQNFNFFGEGAISKSGGKGFVTGFVASLTPQIDLSLMSRSFDRNFHSLFGRAFGENLRNINEKGTYIGIKVKPVSTISLAAFFDRFYFPWLKYGVDAPSFGHEYMLRVNYTPTKKILLYTQWREKSKQINIGRENLYYLDEAIRRNFLINLDYAATKIVTIKSRVQTSSYMVDENTTTGIAVVQDINVNLEKLVISTRFALFDTENFQNRQYVYEKDVLYSFSIPAYNGIGTRNYIMVQYKFQSNLQFWFRYARTHYRDRELVGSGLEQIQGNKRSDIKIQVLYRL